MVLTFVKRLYLVLGLHEVQLWSSDGGFSRVDVETVAVAVWLLSLSLRRCLCALTGLLQTRRLLRKGAV